LPDDQYKPAETQTNLQPSYLTIFMGKTTPVVKKNIIIYLYHYINLILRIKSFILRQSPCNRPTVPYIMQYSSIIRAVKMFKVILLIETSSSYGRAMLSSATLGRN